MLEIIRGLRAVQQQIDVVMAQLVSLVPDSGDRVAETCRALAHTPFCVAEHVNANAYEPLVPGVWLGFAKKAPVEVRQHLRPDTGSENRSYDLTISTGSNFQSSWLTLEFLLKRFVSDAEKPWIERHLAWFGTGLPKDVYKLRAELPDLPCR